jgi:nicotinate phosphoribosyltransferase
MAGDVLSLEHDVQDGEPLLRPAMRGGRPIEPRPTLLEARALAAAELERLPRHFRRLKTEPAYPVEIAPALRAMAAAVDRRETSRH